MPTMVRRWMSGGRFSRGVVPMLCCQASSVRCCWSNPIWASHGDFCHTWAFFLAASMRGCFADFSGGRGGFGMMVMLVNGVASGSLLTWTRGKKIRLGQGYQLSHSRWIAFGRGDLYGLGAHRKTALAAQAHTDF
jgi:hypothetical protein